MNFNNCTRDSLRRKTTASLAAAPCAWNTFSVKSTPMMLTSSKDAPVRSGASTSGTSMPPEGVHPIVCMQDHLHEAFPSSPLATIL